MNTTNRKRNSTKTAVIYKDYGYSYNDIHRQVAFHLENLMNTGNLNVGILYQTRSANYVIACFFAAYMDRVIILVDSCEQSYFGKKGKKLEKK